MKFWLYFRDWSLGRRVEALILEKRKFEPQGLDLRENYASFSVLSIMIHFQGQEKGVGVLWGILLALLMNIILLS